MDDSYIEFAIIHLWQIDIRNLIKSKAILLKEFHISPLEIDKMKYWEYEMILDELSALIKEENDKQEKTMQHSDPQSIMNKYKIGNIQKFAQPNPKSLTIPNVPKLK